MTSEPLWQNPKAQITARIYARYRALVQSAAPQTVKIAETGLGGKFVLCGMLDADGSESVMAANIAGAASLAVTRDADASRLALRDGVLDFAVNSLDEALRILKNEIRKGQTVSVGVEGDAAHILNEIVERGVQPSLLALSTASLARFTTTWNILLARGAELIPDAARMEPVMVWWSVKEAPAIWLPRIDLLASEVLTLDEVLRRRWLRLSARNLSRELRGVRFLTLKAAEADRFIDGLKAFPVEVELSRLCGGEGLLQNLEK